VKTTIETMLDQLAELNSAIDALSLRKQDAIDGVITPEIKAQIDDINLKYAPMLDGALSQITMLESEIKDAVKNHGATVTGTRAQAVYRKGAISWDTKALDGYAVGQPALLAFRTVGSPSVAIRRTVKG